MTRFVVGAVAVVAVLYSSVLATAQEKIEDQIAGTWRGDLAKTQAFLERLDAVPDVDDDSLPDVAQLTVQFGSDHSMRVHEGDREAITAQWKFIKDEDGIVEVDLIRDGNSTRATFEFIDEDTVAISVPNEQVIVFSRATQQGGDGIAAAIIGSWTFDKDATEGLESNAGFDQDQLDDMMQHAGAATVTFSKDGTFSVKIDAGDEPQEIQGTWKSGEMDEETKTFQLSLDADRGPDSVSVELRSDGSVRLTPANEPSAVFVRKKEKATQ
jgi:hypothetical protein